MEAFARFENGEALALEAVPRLPFHAFQDAVAEAVAQGTRLACLCADGELEGYAILADAESHELLAARTVFPSPAFPSLVERCAQAQLFEREIAEQRGLRPDGHPWMKPLRFHRAWGTGRDAWGRAEGAAIAPGVQDFYRVVGEEIHEVAVGPVHAGVIEPGHFRFQCHGERVLHLEIALGYQHRGLERLLVGGPDKLTLKRMETASGDASIGHALAHCLVMEGLRGLEVPVRAQLIRAIALELERLASHTGDLGALSGDAGFLPTASYCGRLRGDWLNMTAQLCGSRLGRDLLLPGGVRFDLDSARLEDLQRRLEATARDTENAVELAFGTTSVLARYEGTGRLTRHQAEEAGLVGPCARACGLERDVRVDFPFGAYREAPPPVALEETGDVAARARVRWREIQASVDFLRWALDALAMNPGGPVSIPADEPLPPFHLAASVVEAWRGPVLHLAVTGGDARFRLYKLVDPSFFDWTGLALALRGEGISDFPLCNKSFNLSYCGFDL